MLTRTAEGVGRGIEDVESAEHIKCSGTRWTLQPACCLNPRRITGRRSKNRPCWARQPNMAQQFRCSDPFGQQLGQRAGQGDVAGAIAEGLTATAGPLAAQEAVGAIPAIRSEIGERMYTPEGKLKPGIHLASKVAGGAVGEATGIPYGGLAGFLGGPEIAKTLFPDPLAEQRQTGAFMNRGYRSMIPPVEEGTMESSKEGRASREFPSRVPEAESRPGAGGEAWSMKRSLDTELQRAVAAGDPGAIAVARRLDPTYRPIIIPKVTVGVK